MPFSCSSKKLLAKMKMKIVVSLHSLPNFLTHGSLNRL